MPFYPNRVRQSGSTFSRSNFFPNAHYKRFHGLGGPCYTSTQRRLIPTIDDDCDRRNAPTFDKLPVELCLTIFEHYIRKYPSFGVDEGPTLLTRVSSQWRCLVLSAPRLWSSFQIDISHSTKVEYVINTMKLWLKRSQECSLSIRIIYRSSCPTANLRAAAFVRELVLHAHRWRHVDFTGPSESMTSLYDLASVPALRSFSLHTLDLWSPVAPLDISALQIPWAQLTSLDLRNDYRALPNLEKCIEILSAAKSLVSCTLKAECALSDSAERQISKVALPTLQKLHLILQRSERHGPFQDSTNPPESSFGRFVGMLHLAEFHTLTIQWLVESERRQSVWAPAHSRFVSFLRKAADSLTSLTLKYLPLSDQDIIDCLKQVPLLTQLDLRFSIADMDYDPITDRLLHSLTLAENLPEAMLLRSLNSVVLHCHGASWTSSVFQAMIESRITFGLAPHAQLKSFHLQVMDSVHDDVLRYCGKWKAVGLDIRIDHLYLR